MLNAQSKLLGMLALCALTTATLGLETGKISTAASNQEMLVEVGPPSTKAEHQALADTYEEEAKRVSADIDRHRRMAMAYRGTRQLSQLGIRIQKHCDALILEYEKALTELKDMATAHREAANKLP